MTTALKTHCVHGHEYTPENTRLQRRNGKLKRSCKQCRTERQAVRRSELRAARDPNQQRGAFTKEEREWYDWVAVARAATGMKVGRRLYPLEIAELMRRCGHEQNAVIAQRVGVEATTVAWWRRRYGA